MDELAMDGDNIVHETGKAADEVYVIRVSQTASGARTWTVGASLPAASDPIMVTARVLALTEAVERALKGAHGRSALSRDLRKSLRAIKQAAA